MAPVYHCVDCWFYSNIPQNITFKVWLVNVKTGSVVASKVYTAHLHVGLQRVRVFIPVKVNNFVKCKVFCKIIKYQHDAITGNNYVAGDAVTFRPWIDIYPTVVWYPVKQKTSYGLLPGDEVKICVGIHVPKGVKLANIHVKYRIAYDVVGKHETRTISSRSFILNSVGDVATIWYNRTLILPWTDRLLVQASAENKYDLAPDNNNISTTIHLSPDLQCLSAGTYSPVPEGTRIPVRISVRSNYVDVTGTASVIDVTAGNVTIGSSTFKLLSPEQTITVWVRVPKVGTSPYHEWFVFASIPNDVYVKDSVKSFTVKIAGNSSERRIHIPGFTAIEVAVALMALILLSVKRRLS